MGAGSCNSQLFTVFSTTFIHASWDWWGVQKSSNTQVIATFLRDALMYCSEVSIFLAWKWLPTFLLKLHICFIVVSSPLFTDFLLPASLARLQNCIVPELHRAFFLVDLGLLVIPRQRECKRPYSCSAVSNFLHGVSSGPLKCSPHSRNQRWA